jgi:predicted GNAT family acetyltransferase
MNHDLTPSHEPDNDRYVITDDSTVVGFTEYHLRGGDHYFFYHTLIDDDYAGQGVGSKLARFALDDVREKGGFVVPLCPFIAGWIEKHPDYQDLVDRVIWDRVTRSQG